LIAAPVIVGITSLPSRIGFVGPCLKALLAGSLIPNKILLSLPSRSIREGAAYELPDFLTIENRSPIVQVVTTDRDWGPGTKLLGALPHLPKPCYLVLADDDVIYRPTFLENLVRAQAGDHTASFSYHVYKWGGLNIGQGCDGFSFWSPNLAAVESFARTCVEGTNLMYHDDLWISFYLASRRIAIRPVDYVGRELAYEKLHEINALSHLKGEMARRRLTRQGIKQMIEKIDMPQRWKTRMRMNMLYDRLISPVRKFRRKIARVTGR
jgi:hypothetical protein